MRVRGHLGLEAVPRAPAVLRRGLRRLHSLLVGARLVRVRDRDRVRVRVRVRVARATIPTSASDAIIGAGSKRRAKGSLTPPWSCEVKSGRISAVNPCGLWGQG